MSSLDEIRSVFLAEGLDEDVRSDNERVLRDWEEGLRHNEAFASWQDSDITKQIVQQAKQTYIECALLLAQNRDLTDRQRDSLYAKQDAALWLLALTNKDAKKMLESIEAEIKAALSQI